MDYQNYSTPPDESGSDLFSSEPVVYATFWERLGAWLIDMLILAVPNVILSLLDGPDPGVGNLMILVGNWLYFALQESGKIQATIGKKAVGLKVINEQGHQISFGQATGRYFGKIISGIILLIGYLMVLWDPKKQALHDKMANTYVVKR